MGLLEIGILIGLFLLVVAVIITDNEIENEHLRYKCFLNKIYRNRATMKTGCQGIPDDKICKHCTYYKRYLKNNKTEKENK